MIVVNENLIPLEKETIQNIRGKLLQEFTTISSCCITYNIAFIKAIQAEIIRRERQNETSRQLKTTQNNSFSKEKETEDWKSDEICKLCKSAGRVFDKCIITSAQTRGSDEATTLFVSCTTCGKVIDVT